MCISYRPLGLRFPQDQIVFRGLALMLSLCMISSLAMAVPSHADQYHKKLDTLLSSYVREEPGIGLLGRTFSRRSVKYRQLHGSPGWQDYIAGLAYASEPVLKGASAEAQKAFWLNTFNVLVIASVARTVPSLQEAPRSSPLFWKTPHNVAGRTYTLEQIRELLYNFSDPRVAFAMTEASAGSPSLPEKAFTATNIDRQLDEAVRNIASDPSFVRLVRGQNTLYLAEIFELEAVAFSAPAWRTPAHFQTYPPPARTIIALVAPYLTEPERKFFAGGKVQIKFMPSVDALNNAR
jgi:hypothetical protein